MWNMSDELSIERTPEELNDLLQHAMADTTATADTQSIKNTIEWILGERDRRPSVQFAYWNIYECSECGWRDEGYHRGNPFTICDDCDGFETIEIKERLDVNPKFS